MIGSMHILVPKVSSAKPLEPKNNKPPLDASDHKIKNLSAVISPNKVEQNEEQIFSEVIPDNPQKAFELGKRHEEMAKERPQLMEAFIQQAYKCYRVSAQYGFKDAEELLKKKLQELRSIHNEKSAESSTKTLLWLRMFFKDEEWNQKNPPNEFNAKRVISILTAEAQKGDVRSKVELGYCYELGLGVQKDSNKSIEWFCEAAKAKSLHAKRIVVTHIDKQKEAIQKLSQAPDLVNPKKIGSIEYTIANLYKQSQTSPNDLEASRFYFAEAASRGNARLNWNLPDHLDQEMEFPKISKLQLIGSIMLQARKFQAPGWKLIGR